MSENKKEFIDKIDKKIIFRMRMFAVIFLATLIYIIYDVVKYQVPYSYLLAGFAIGLIVGLILGRMQKLTRDKDVLKVVSRIDVVGIIIIVLYVGFAIARHKYIYDRFEGMIATEITIAIVNGTMLGRIITIRYNIKSILQKVKNSKNNDK